MLEKKWTTIFSNFSPQHLENERDFSPIIWTLKKLGNNYNISWAIMWSKATKCLLEPRIYPSWAYILNFLFSSLYLYIECSSERELLVPFLLTVAFLVPAESLAQYVCMLIYVNIYMSIYILNHFIFFQKHCRVGPCWKISKDFFLLSL